MNADQLKGRWAQFEGELKKQSKFADDDSLQIEGDYQKSQPKYGDEKEEISYWVHRWFERHEAEAEPRGKEELSN